jgi:hypothetical protein
MPVACSSSEGHGHLQELRPPRIVASDTFAEFLREQLALGRGTMRRMFGKTGVFCDGLMFGSARGRERRS